MRRVLRLFQRLRKSDSSEDSGGSSSGRIRESRGVFRRTLSLKVLQIIPVLVVVTFFTTALSDLIPGSTALAYLGPNAGPAAVNNFNREYGLDHSLLHRYWSWVTNALQGNLGLSYQTHSSVSHIIAQHLAVTVEVGLLALLISLLLTVPLSMLSAIRPGGLIDRVVTGTSSVLIAVPVFITSVLIVYVFSVRAGLFPSSGWASLSAGIGPNLRHVALPVITVVLGVTPLLVRVLRGDIVSTLGQEFVIAARARGLPNLYILFRHVLRASMASLLTLMGLILGFLFAGSIVVETFFGLPGLGLLASNAVTQKDLPIVQGVVVFVAIIYLLANILVDLLYAVLDPRIGSHR